MRSATHTPLQIAGANPKMLTDSDIATFSSLIERQSASPVVPEITVADLTARGTVEEALRFYNARQDAIVNMAAYPLTHCWEPDIWRRIDLEVARKRLAHPGRVLEVFITGGMRPGKSFSCARRMVAHWLYAEDATVFGLADTQATSRTLQQQPVESFLPEEVSPLSGKHKTTKHDRYKFSGGHFTNDEFALRVPVSDETGRKFLGGGKFMFRFFNQELSTFQGYAVSAAWSDELVPLDRVKTIFERMGTRAEETRRKEHLYRIGQAVKILESGRRLPVELLGAVYHGVHLISFTPYLGWNETVNYFLAGAVKREFEIAPELAGKPGVTDPRVPRFAQPKRETALAAYIFTNDNKIKPDTNLLEEMKSPARTEREIRIKLYGDVSKDHRSEFLAVFDPARHLCDWQDLPRTGTLYEVFDPAGAKPWALGWYIVDALERVWMVQEWPCESIAINGGLPGPWAVPSESARMNGDEGPAWKMRLGWSLSKWVLQIWEGRARIIRKMKETGAEWQGAREKRTLILPGDAKAEEADFAMPFLSIIDSRFAGAKVDAERGGEQITVLDRLFEDDNAILCEPAEGVRMDEGNLLIADRLAARVLGDQAALRINRECTNTQFMLENYTVPEFKADTVKKDEACKEWRDLMAYLLLSRPRYFNPERWKRKPEAEWGY